MMHSRKNISGVYPCLKRLSDTFSLPPGVFSKQLSLVRNFVNDVRILKSSHVFEWWRSKDVSTVRLLKDHIVKEGKFLYFTRELDDFAYAKEASYVMGYSPWEQTFSWKFRGVTDHMLETTGSLFPKGSESMPSKFDKVGHSGMAPEEVDFADKRLVAAKREALERKTKEDVDDDGDVEMGAQNSSKQPSIKEDCDVEMRESTAQKDALLAKAKRGEVDEPFRIETLGFGDDCVRRCFHRMPLTIARSFTILNGAKYSCNWKGQFSKITYDAHTRRLLPGQRNYPFYEFKLYTDDDHYIALQNFSPHFSTKRPWFPSDVPMTDNLREQLPCLYFNLRQFLEKIMFLFEGLFYDKCPDIEVRRTELDRYFKVGHQWSFIPCILMGFIEQIILMGFSIPLEVWQRKDECGKFLRVLSQTDYWKSAKPFLESDLENSPIMIADYTHVGSAAFIKRVDKGFKKRKEYSHKMGGPTDLSAEQVRNNQTHVCLFFSKNRHSHHRSLSADTQCSLMSSIISRKKTQRCCKNSWLR